MLNLCDICENKHKDTYCPRCIDNPNFILGSYYTPYKEVCPKGEWGCPNDPGYILYNFPDKFKELFGDITPEEAVKLGECKVCGMEAS